ncbi:hypothetical protein ACQCWA_19420 [Rossellomorea aquimaris]|uniref:hypothetical protein n=1 Tax=Rossellomorea aquimaris TaxID=189382 RepID=UPI003CE8C13E
MKRVIVYVHEYDEKIVSKYCPKCRELKLTEDFNKTNLKGMLTSICVECDQEKEEEK